MLLERKPFVEMTPIQIVTEKKNKKKFKKIQKNSKKFKNQVCMSFRMVSEIITDCLIAKAFYRLMELITLIHKK